MKEIDDNESFEQASLNDSGGLFADLFAFMGENKKWWLLPIIAVLGLLGLVVVLAGTSAAPFIYTLF